MTEFHLLYKVLCPPLSIFIVLLFKRIFSTERPKKLGTKAKDTFDPALECYNFPKEFHTSSVIKSDNDHLILLCYGGQDRVNPSTNYSKNLLFLTFKYDPKSAVVYQEATKIAPSCEPHSTTSVKNVVHGSYFPPLTMSAMATLDNQTFMWGGLDLDRDQCSNELYNFFNITFSLKNGDPQLKCKMFPGPQTIQQSGYSSTQASKFGIQLGEIPEPRMGHALIGCSGSLIMIGGHTKQWKGQTLQFKNMEHNLFAMNPKTKEWFRIEILNGDVELLRRRLFMCCVSGIDI